MTALVATAFALLVLVDGASVSDIRTACAATSGQPSIAGISVRDEAAEEGDLPSLRVSSDATGAFMRVYYDPLSEAAARTRAACLGAQLPIVERETGDDRRGAEWWGAVFTQDPGYWAPSSQDLVPRWTVPVQPDGHVSAHGHMTVVNTMPHEQVHAYHRRAVAGLPRWLAEGHAAWIQRRITPDIDPQVEEKNLRLLATDAARSSGSVNLARWGSRRPKREAIMRQVSPEERARMEADPNFRPTGSFTFRADDWEGEAVNTSGLYMAATAVFEGLEARHGVEAIRVWMAEITATSGLVSPDTVAESIQRHFGESIDELLAEKPLPAPPL